MMQNILLNQNCQLAREFENLEFRFQSQNSTLEIRMMGEIYFQKYVRNTYENESKNQNWNR